VAKVLALLSHYFQPDLLDPIDELSMANWIDVLRDLPEQAIDDAIGEWLREKTTRPTPAHIRMSAKRRLVVPSVMPGPAPFAALDVPADELERREKVCAEMTNVYKFLRPMPRGE